MFSAVWSSSYCYVFIWKLIPIAFNRPAKLSQRITACDIQYDFVIMIIDYFNTLIVQFCWFRMTVHIVELENSYDVAPL